MKKIVILSGIIISTLVSCSTDDDMTSTNQESKKTVLSKRTDLDLCITCRDTIGRVNDSLPNNIDPVKPDKPR